MNNPNNPRSFNVEGSIRELHFKNEMNCAVNLQIKGKEEQFQKLTEPPTTLKGRGNNGSSLHQTSFVQAQKKSSRLVI